MDPSWGTDCVYCKQLSDSPVDPSPVVSKLPTVEEDFAKPSPGRGRKTEVVNLPTAELEPVPSGPRSRRPTEVISEQSTKTNRGVIGEQRKIVGVLLTYSWKPEGQIFPIREGRNRIGSDADECDIVLPEDANLSRKHATIMYRAMGSRTFQISDELSMNATLVDGEVLEGPKPLRNYSTIKTGSTVWTFIAAVAPTSAAAPTPAVAPTPAHTPLR
jgi:hypothetical protein